MAPLGFLKIKVFWNKFQDVITFFDDVTNKILSRDWNYITGAAMWPKFGNCSISMRSYHNLNFIMIWLEKTFFLSGGFGSSLIIGD